MKPSRIFALALLLSFTAAGFSQNDAIDTAKVRQLIERQRGGATLSAEEKAYIERAEATRQKRPDGAAPAAGADGIDWNKAQTLFRRSQSGEKLNAEEQAYLDKAKAARNRGGGGGSAGAPANQRKAPASLKPLSDMTAADRYEGEDGGLYGGGKNTPPEALAKAASAALAQIKPIDGKVVLVSISMSNATMEFSTFKRIADADSRKSPQLTIVDCAQGGQAMAEWVNPDGRPWQEAMNRIANAQVSPAQVQVAWIKLANKGPGGSMAEHLAKLETDTTKVLQNAKAKFPNLRIAYLGSRIWAGNAKGGLNPEPYAYESAFGVRHLIQQQMKGDAALAADRAPLLLWGPYLWAEGTSGRKLDGLKYEPQDFTGDGVHPSESGRMKVAGLLLEFFATDPLAKSWFAK